MIALNLKKWISSVNITIKNINTSITNIQKGLALLSSLGEVTVFSTSSNTTKSIDLEDGARRLIFGAGASTSKAMAIISATSSGTSSYRWVHQGSSDITLTNGTNKITLNNSTGNAIKWVMIDFH